MEYIGYAVAIYLIVAVGYRAVTDKPLKETLMWPKDVFDRLR